MPNQSNPTQNPNPAGSPVDQPVGQTAIPPVPPVIFPQSDLPPLSPEFQNLPGTDAAVPADQSPIQQVIVNTGSSAPPETPSVTPKAKKKFGGGKIIATILGLVVLIGGVGAGILLTQQPQLFKQKAAGNWPPNGAACHHTDGTEAQVGGCAIYWCPNGCGDDKCDGNDNGAYITHNSSCPGAETELGGYCGQIDVVDQNRTYCIPYDYQDSMKQCGVDCINPPPRTSPPGTPTPTPTFTPTPTPSSAPKACHDACYPDGSQDGCQIGLWCGHFGPAEPQPVCVNRDCSESNNCICTTPPPGTTPTPTPLACHSVCDPLNDRCPDPLNCVKYPDDNYGTCVNPSCEQSINCICGTSIPTPTPRPPAPYCVAVTTYKTSGTSGSSVTTTTPGLSSSSGTSWTLIPESDRSKLKAGDAIYFCVSGYNPSGTFDKARFTINGVKQPETTIRRPGSTDICQSYTIPSGTRSLTVLGEIHDTIFGWFGGISTN